MSLLPHQGSDDSDVLSETSSAQSDEIPEPEELYSLWDWPLNEDGLARAVEGPDRFFVNLDFSSLQNGSRDIDVRKFENWKSSSCSWSLGLCSVSDSAQNDQSSAFWRLELQIIKHLNMIVIEAFRELNRDDKKRRTMRKMKKIFKLPEDFDIDTLQTKISKNGVYLQAFRRKIPVISPSLRRQSSAPSTMLRRQSSTSSTLARVDPQNEEPLTQN